MTFVKGNTIKGGAPKRIGPDLNLQEIWTVELMAKGLSTKMVASELKCSESCINGRILRMKKYTGTQSIFQLAVYLERIGILKETEL